MSDNTTYEIMVFFKLDNDTTEAELRDYLHRVPGVRAIETDAFNTFIDDDGGEQEHDLRYVISYREEADAIGDMEALKRLLDNCPATVTKVTAFETNDDTGEMQEVHLPGSNLNFI